MRRTACSLAQYVFQCRREFEVPFEVMPDDLNSPSWSIIFLAGYLECRAHLLAHTAFKTMAQIVCDRFRNHNLVIFHGCNLITTRSGVWMTSYKTNSHKFSRIQNTFRIKIVFFMPCITPRATASISNFRKGALAIPIPCSPDRVPPKARASGIRSSQTD